ncbi:MAG: hypothetical protein F6K09_01460 [Merismopedia sp. SIO2A8]|nr:hypothetical protein [Merismopedia sp. SIO2A8]
MDGATQYWIFLTATGETVLPREQAIAQRYFRATLPSILPDFSTVTPFPHRDIQRQLFQSHQDEVLSFTPASIPSTAASALSLSDPITPAETCLRCCISHHIDYACQQLADQFGPTHGFNRMTLVSSVLNDEYLLSQASPSIHPTASLVDQDRTATVTATLSKPATQTYRSLATDIFESFDPNRSSLKSWTFRLVRQDGTVNSILLSHGVYLVSDWAILNDTKEAQLERILTEFCTLSVFEIRQSSLLLESYHRIYRGDRLRYHQTGRCLAPTPEQLIRIAHYLQSLQLDEDIHNSTLLTAHQVLSQLQTLAQHLRDYRIHSRCGTLPTASVDISDDHVSVTQANDDDDNMAEDFMVEYRQAFDASLDAAIQTVIEQRVAKLGKRKGERDKLYLKGLQLFHGEGLTMTEIAPHLDYERQDKVTYLLQLKELRADIRHEMLTQLRDRVRDIAQQFTNVDRLQTIDQQLDGVLEEQIVDLMTDAERETAGARSGPLHSRFSQHLCHYLNNR